MFDTLIQSLEGLWGALINSVQAAWDWLKAGYGWLCGIVVVIVGLLDTVVNNVYTMLQNLADALGNLAMPSGQVATAPAEFLAMANTFFPLDAAVTMALALCLLWA